MPISITEAFVEQFDTTLRLKAQQTDSRLSMCVTDRGNITGESFTINMLGTVDELDEDNTRHGDTTWSDIAHTTPYANMQDFYKALPVDKADEPKMLINPAGEYMQRLITARNLRKDKIIYDALRGTMLFKDGTSGALPSGQKIAHGSTGFTKAKIVQAKTMFRANEVDEHAGEELYMIYNANAMQDILNDSDLTDFDRMSVKMLQEGNVATKWCGFKWIPFERIYTSGGVSYTVAWCKSALQIGTGFESGNVSRRNDKKDTLQVSMAASYGATRTEDVKVVEIAFQ